MHPTSTLQAQYPLSSRKFWKKMIEKIVPLTIFVIVMFVAVLFIIAAFNPGQHFSHYLPLALMLGVVAWIAAFVLYAWYVKAYISRYYYDANDHFVTIKKGVFAPAEIHVQYGKIQDVYVDQDILDRIMGLYDVHIASATVASGIEAHIDGVEASAAEGLKELFLAKLRGGPALSVSAAGTPDAAGTMPAMAASAGPVKFDREISSTTYPVTGLWIVQQATAWFFSSAIYAIILDVWLGLPGKNDTPSAATAFHFSSGTFWTVGIAVFLVIYLAHVVYAILWRSTFSFSFLPDYVVTKSGIISKSETHLPYRSVQDVTVSQGIIERLFGLATVRIENAAQMVTSKGRRVSTALRLPGQPIAKANEISDALKKVALAHSSAGTGL